MKETQRSVGSSVGTPPPDTFSMLVSAMTRSGLKRTGFATILNIDPAHLFRVIKGERRITPDLQRRIFQHWKELGFTPQEVRKFSDLWPLEAQAVTKIFSVRSSQTPAAQIISIAEEENCFEVWETPLVRFEFKSRTKNNRAITQEVRQGLTDFGLIAAHVRAADWSDLISLFRIGWFADHRVSETVALVRPQILRSSFEVCRTFYRGCYSAIQELRRTRQGRETYLIECSPDLFEEQEKR